MGLGSAVSKINSVAAVERVERGGGQLGSSGGIVVIFSFGIIISDGNLRIAACAAPPHHDIINEVHALRSVVVSQNTEALSTEIPEHRVLQFRNTAKFESAG